VTASPKGVRKRPFLARAIRRGLRVMDPALSRIELRASGLELRSPTSHEERLVLLPAAPVLRSAGTVVYDIGAAAGAYATAFSKVSTVSQIIAFEPLAESYAALERGARDVSSIRCFRLALGDENGRLDLHRSLLRDTSSLLPISDTMRAHFPLGAEIEGAESVAVARLDDVVAEHGLPPPDFVKMDVQGFEDRVIRGGAATLRSARLFIVEVSFRPLYEGSALFDDVYMLMRELRFVLAGFEGPLWSPSGELLQSNALFEPSDAPPAR
jgi:FkbM family methyltransferase